jgi:hypothetical protein
MNMRSALLSLGVATAMSAGVVGYAIPALSAPPAPRSAECSGNRTCVYDGGTGQGAGPYTGLLGSRTPGTTLANISVANRDKLSSWENFTSTGARFYYGLNGNGTCVPMYAQDSATAVSTNPDNNQAESHAYTRTC